MGTRPTIRSRLFISKQGWTCGAAEERGVDVGSGVRAFSAAPGVDEGEDGESSGVDGEAGAEAVAEVVDADVAAAESDFCFVGGEERADGEFAERVLDGATEEEQVGAAETVVGIAGQDGRAVEIGAANGGHEVEGDLASFPCEGLRDEGAEIDGAFELAG
jgi:hypothetical protein